MCNEWTTGSDVNTKFDFKMAVESCYIQIDINIVRNSCSKNIFQEKISPPVYIYIYLFGHTPTITYIYVVQI